MESGEAPAPLEDEPLLPEFLAPAARCFWALSRRRLVGADTLQPIPVSEIWAWSKVVGMRREFAEELVEWVSAADDAWVEIMRDRLRQRPSKGGGA